MAAPIAKGDEVEVRIDSLAYGGNGVGRLEGFVVFVRGGLPGDVVRARATKVKRGFAEATKTALLEPGPDRVEAPCRHFGICGGCRFQDLDYASQLDAKRGQVRDALVRLGGFAEPPLEPIVPARSIYGYRNKLEYSFASDGAGGLVLGFHRAGRWDEVIDVEECLLTTDLGNAIREAVKEWARAEGLEPYDQETQAGYLRHLVVREGRNTGQGLVLLVTAPGERFDTDFLIETLTRFPEVRSIHWAVNDRPAEVTNLPTRLLWGEPWIEEELVGLRFRIRPNAFLQTNTEMAETLYALAREAAGLTGTRPSSTSIAARGRSASRSPPKRGRCGAWRSPRSRSPARSRTPTRTGSRTRGSSPATSGSRSRSSPSGPALPTSWSSTRLVPAWPARRCGARVPCRRRASSTSPATRRLWPRTSPSSATSTATSSSGTPVDMFPHTPHIESVSLLVRAPDRS